MCCSYEVSMWSSQFSNQQKKNPMQNVPNSQTYGMTSAISTAPPKPTDIVKTLELEECLKPYDVFMTEQELNHRLDILSKLNTLVRKWIRDVSIAGNMPKSVADTVGGKINTFGSYRLGVSYVAIYDLSDFEL